MKECDRCPTCGQGDLALLPRCEWCRLPVSLKQTMKEKENGKTVHYHPACHSEWKNVEGLPF